MTLSKDNRYVSVLPQKSLSAPTLPGKSSYVYATLSKNAEARYFCCYGSTISGPSSFFGAAYGVAEQFTLAASATIGHLAAGVGYVSGDDKVTLTLYKPAAKKKRRARGASRRTQLATVVRFMPFTVTRAPGVELRFKVPPQFNQEFRRFAFENGYKLNELLFAAFDAFKKSRIRESVNS